ncbi:MAG: hypothetical protein AAGM38_01105, partial [Pseudomonadota bacterium]
MRNGSMGQGDAMVIQLASDAPLALPNDPAFLTAEYLRDGGDLRIEAPNGAVVTVERYFEADAPVDLVIGEAVVSGRIVGKLARPAEGRESAPESVAA